MDWRRRETYDPIDALPRKGWAWEFLRRNPDFHGAWLDTSSRTVTDASLRALTIITTPHNGRLREWGLMFRRRTSDRCDCSLRVVGSGRLPICAPHDRAAG
ncbi:MAG TPA: DUF6499 domain-containing protein [Stellaceae bacterium]|nr:DUF6499 domain-containing protein [Stellaceae bacterium]